MKSAKEQIEQAINILKLQEKPLENIRSMFKYHGIPETAFGPTVDIVANMRLDVLTKLEEALKAFSVEADSN